MKRVLFISSTGGHLDEMLQLKSMFNDYDYYIITEKTKSNLSLKDKYPSHVSYLVYGTQVHFIKYLFKFGWNCLKSFFLYIKLRPQYIVTTGTHTAVPMCVIGHTFGSKVVFIETFANSQTRTKSGAYLYDHGFTDLFIVQWKSMLKLYPKAVYGGWIF